MIVRAGCRSEHLRWLTGTPEFDLIIYAYEELPAALCVGGDVITFTGRKVAAWHELFAENPHLLTDYERIALLDDDLICTAADINAAFMIGARHGLSIWQPSLSWDSYYSYGVTLHNPLFTLRYVNFIEMMCAFFSVEQLVRVLPLFTLGYEISIDRFWCRMRPDWRGAYAVVDAVQFRHARPVGQVARARDEPHCRRGGTRNVYQADIDHIEVETGIVFQGPVAYCGVTSGGRRIGGRVLMALSAIMALGAARRSVDEKFLKPVIDHIRHILFRPIDNEPLDLSEIKARITKAA